MSIISRRTLNLYKHYLKCTFNLNYFQTERMYSNEHIYNSLLPKIEIPDITLTDYLFPYFKKWSNRIAIECFETERQLTYDELGLKISAFAANFRNLINIKEGDAVSVILPNVLEYPIVAIGIVAAQCVCSTCNPTYTIEEIKRQIIDSESKCIVTIDVLYPTIQQIVNLLPHPLPVIIIKTETKKIPTSPNVIDFESLINPNFKQINYQNVSTNNVIFRPYSSGTSGLPKGVDLSHRNVVSNLIQQESLGPICHSIPELGPDYPLIVPAILPFFHIYGLSVILQGKFSQGHRIVTMPKITGEKIIEMFKKYRPHSLNLVPPLILMMISNPHFTKDDLSNVGLILSSAAPLSAEDMLKLRDKVSPSCKITQGYGLTETSPVAIGFNEMILDTYDYASVGSPVPNTEIRLVDSETGKDVEKYLPGEIWIRGPQVMKGYFNNKAATAEAITEDGWFKTGDVARYQENKQFYIIDRLKELIKVKGFQVAPAELEGLLRTHPDIAESAVIAVPDKYTGEAPRAFVVLKNGSKLTENEIKTFIAKQVTEYKQLAGGVIIVTDIPKNSSGKILRKELRKFVT